MIEIGKNAPDFTLPRDGGADLTLSSLRPKAVVLFFYPKADTPGCTKEAVGFTGHAADFEAAGAVAVGVSKDPVKKLDKFRDKHALGVALVSDETSDVCERYGTWVEKSMYGKNYMGIERTTLLIDGTGVVRQVWSKVKVPGHVEEVLAAVRAL